MGAAVREGECARLIEMINRSARPSELFDTSDRRGYRTSYSDLH